MTKRVYNAANRDDFTKLRITLNRPPAGTLSERVSDDIYHYMGATVELNQGYTSIGIYAANIREIERVRDSLEGTASLSASLSLRTLPIYFKPKPPSEKPTKPKSWGRRKHGR